MKKTYKNPEIEVIKVVSKSQMLAGSPGIGGEYGGGTPEGREDENLDW